MQEMAPDVSERPLQFVQRCAQSFGLQTKKRVLSVVVFGVTLGWMILRHQTADPTWVPHGADWDTWFQSVSAIGHPGIKYPPNRWPTAGRRSSSC